MIVKSGNHLWVTLAAMLIVAPSLLTAADSEVETASTSFLENDQCYQCHFSEDIMPEHFLVDDVHMHPGLSCAGCHGGDPTSDDEDIAMSEDAGFVGVPDPADIPGFCGRCHSDIEFMRQYQPRIPTDQVSRYFTSRHGLLLKDGDRNVATCVDCHTSHGVLPASDARSTVFALNVPATCNDCHGDANRMGDYDIATDQYDRFAQSVHGVALLANQDTGAPACNDCHGNHGALPPGTSSISQVCGHCHVNNMRYFETTKMAQAFEEQSMHGCEECHGNHGVQRASDEMVGTHESSVCMDCHEVGDNGALAAKSIRMQLDSLSTIYETAVAQQEEVHRKGMDDVEIGFLLQEAHQSLIQARTLVHTFDPQKVGPKTREGVDKSETALEMAAATIEDYYFRRRGFGLGTLFITVLVIALFFKIRQMEGR